MEGGRPSFFRQVGAPRRSTPRNSALNHSTTSFPRRIAVLITLANAANVSAPTRRLRALRYLPLDHREPEPALRAVVRRLDPWIIEEPQEIAPRVVPPELVQ